VEVLLRVKTRSCGERPHVSSQWLRTFGSAYADPRRATERAGGRRGSCQTRWRVDETVKALRCPPGYGAVEARKDRHRLEDFFYKRLGMRRCGGTLTDAEDAEEAQLTARVAAFEQTPEGRGRCRILELERKRFYGLSPAEQMELEILRGLYPELPPHVCSVHACRVCHDPPHKAPSSEPPRYVRKFLAGVATRRPPASIRRISSMIGQAPYVRFASIATELPHRSDPPLHAISELHAVQQKTPHSMALEVIRLIQSSTKVAVVRRRSGSEHRTSYRAQLQSMLE
jgi:hypothetical protein